MLQDITRSECFRNKYIVLCHFYFIFINRINKTTMYKEKVVVNCKKCGRAITAEIPENTCGCVAQCPHCSFSNHVVCSTWTCGHPQGVKVVM